MTRGKEVFAESCAVCHSSKQPPSSIDPHSGDGKAWFRAAVMKPDFLENNFLSDERRYPLTQIETKSARALASNAKGGHILDNFSSQTYKELSPVDELDFSTRLMKRIRSSSGRRTRTPAPAIIELRRSLASGAQRRSCTTTRSENSPAIRQWRAG
jgi:hypothetical protein